MFMPIHIFFLDYDFYIDNQIQHEVSWLWDGILIGLCMIIVYERFIQYSTIIVNIE